MAAVVLALTSMARADIARAWDAMETEDWDLAQTIAESELAAAATPEAAFAAREVLAMLAYSLDEAGPAIKTAKALDAEAIQTFGPNDPRRVFALEILADLREETGDLAGAIRAYARAIAIGRNSRDDPDGPLVSMLYLGDLTLRNGDPRTAAIIAAEVQGSVEAGVSSSEELFLSAAILRARAHLILNQPATALEYAAPVLRRNDLGTDYPDIYDALVRFDADIAALAEQRGDATAVLDDWASAALTREEYRLRLEEASIADIADLAREVHQGGDPSRADAIGEAIAATEPADSPVPFKVATILLAHQLVAGDRLAALRWARRVVAFPAAYVVTTDFSVQPIRDVINWLANERRFGEAADISRFVLDLASHREDDGSTDLDQARLDLVDMLLAGNDPAGAEIEIRPAIPDTGAPGAGISERLAEALRLQGDLVAAREVLDTALLVRGLTTEDRADLLGALGRVLIDAGEPEVALAPLEEAVVLRRTNDETGAMLAATLQLATAQRAAGHAERALDTFAQARRDSGTAIGKNSALGRDMAMAEARLLREAGRIGEAESRLAEAALLEVAIPDQPEADALALLQLAQIAWGAGDTAGADQLASRAAHAVAGPGPIALSIDGLRGKLALSRGDAAGALAYLRPLTQALSTPGLRDWPGSRAHLADHAAAALRLAASAPNDARKLHNEAFAAIQEANGLTAAAALAQAALRRSATPELAALIRRMQDTEREIATSRQSLAMSINERDRSAGIDRKLDALEELHKGLEDSVHLSFPEFTALAFPRPVPLDVLTGMLEPDEAVAVFATIDSATSGGMVALVTREGLQFGQLPVQRRLRDVVYRLRCAAALTDPACGTARGAVRGSFSLDEEPTDRSHGPEFDLALAHEAFAAVLGPVAQGLDGKTRLIIVPDSLLASLPFGILAERAPDPGDDVSSAPWLIRRMSISMMPTVAALAEQRSRVNRLASQDGRFLGVGDPLIGAQRLGRLPFPCDDEAALTVTRALGSSFGGGENSGEIATMAALPETRCELSSSAALFRNRATLLTAENATETALRHLDNRGDLAEFTSITFATHGLIAGELGPHEAGLVMTPPIHPNEVDDGLLTASEIAALRLDADLVILSACNTAAGSGQAGEGLSGLASAFFYAGARSLMVSQWPVYSDASARLSAGTLTNIHASRELSADAALRDTILDVISDPDATDRERHPAYWGAFLVAGGS